MSLYILWDVYLQFIQSNSDVASTFYVHSINYKTNSKKNKLYKYLSKLCFKQNEWFKIKDKESDLHGVGARMQNLPVQLSSIACPKLDLKGSVNPEIVKNIASCTF